MARPLLNVMLEMPPPTPELVLIVNLGTPRAATAEAVTDFLREFLSDPLVVDYPRILWRPLLERIILRSRPTRVAEMYRSITSEDGGMPLARGTEAIAAALGSELGPRFEVRQSYRYGDLSIAQQLAEALEAGRSTTVVPLFPQRTASSSETIVQCADRASLAAGGSLVRVTRIPADDAGYIEALADRVRSAGVFQHLVVSFHGIPRRYDRREGGIYQADCRATVHALVTALGIAPSDVTLCFQSRFGPEPWIGPATFDTLQALAKRGVRDVAVIMPGFLTEGLETLEEIGIRGRAAFLAAGGSGFVMVPAVTAHPAFIAGLAARIRAERQQYEETTAHAG